MTQLIELGIASRHGERGLWGSHRKKPGEVIGFRGLLGSGAPNLAEKFLEGRFDSWLVIRR